MKLSGVWEDILEAAERFMTDKFGKPIEYAPQVRIYYVKNSSKDSIEKTNSVSRTIFAKKTVKLLAVPFVRIKDDKEKELTRN